MTTTSNPFYQMLVGQGGTLPSQSTARNSNLPDLDALSGNEMLENPAVLEVLREFYRDRDGVDIYNDDELRDYFYSDRSWRNWNTVSIGRDVADAYSMNAEQRDRMSFVEDVYQRLPSVFSSGGRGIGSVLADLAGPVALDPTNLIGFGAAGSVARGATAAGSSIARGTLRGIGRGALVEGGIGAGVEAASDAALQARDIQLGLQDSYSPLQTLTSAAMGGVSGAALSAPLNLPAALGGARIGQGDYTARLGREAAAQVEADAAAAAAASQQPRVDPTNNAFIATAETDLNTRIGMILDDLNDQVDDIRSAGGDPEVEQQLLQIRDRANAILRNEDIIRNIDQQIERAARSATSADQLQGLYAQRSALESERARFSSMDPAAIRREIEAEIEARREAEAAEAGSGGEEGGAAGGGAATPPPSTEEPAGRVEGEQVTQPEQEAVEPEEAEAPEPEPEPEEDPFAFDQDPETNAESEARADNFNSLNLSTPTNQRMSARELAEAFDVSQRRAIADLRAAGWTSDREGALRQVAEDYIDEFGVDLEEVDPITEVNADRGSVLPEDEDHIDYILRLLNNDQDITGEELLQRLEDTLGFGDDLQEALQRLGRLRTASTDALRLIDPAEIADLVRRSNLSEADQRDLMYQLRRVAEGLMERVNRGDVDMASARLAMDRVVTAQFERATGEAAERRIIARERRQAGPRSKTSRPTDEATVYVDEQGNPISSTTRRWDAEQGTTVSGGSRVTEEGLTSREFGDDNYISVKNFEVIEEDGRFNVYDEEGRLVADRKTREAADRYVQSRQDVSRSRGTARRLRNENEITQARNQQALDKQVVPVKAKHSGVTADGKNFKPGDVVYVIAPYRSAEFRIETREFRDGPAYYVVDGDGNQISRHPTGDEAQAAVDQLSTTSSRTSKKELFNAYNKRSKKGQSRPYVYGNRATAENVTRREGDLDLDHVVIRTVERDEATAKSGLHLTKEGIRAERGTTKEREILARFPPGSEGKRMAQRWINDNVDQYKAKGVSDAAEVRKRGGGWDIFNPDGTLVRRGAPFSDRATADAALQRMKRKVPTIRLSREPRLPKGQEEYTGRPTPSDRASSVERPKKEGKRQSKSQEAAATEEPPAEDVLPEEPDAEMDQAVADADAAAAAAEDSIEAGSVPALLSESGVVFTPSPKQLESGINTHAALLERFQQRDTSRWIRGWADPADKQGTFRVENNSQSGEASSRLARSVQESQRIEAQSKKQRVQERKARQIDKYIDSPDELQSESAKRYAGYAIDTGESARVLGEVANNLRSGGDLRGSMEGPVSQVLGQVNAILNNKRFARNYKHQWNRVGYAIKSRLWPLKVQLEDAYNRLNKMEAADQVEFARTRGEEMDRFQQDNQDYWDNILESEGLGDIDRELRMDAEEFVTEGMTQWDATREMLASRQTATEASNVDVPTAEEVADLLDETVKVLGAAENRWRELVFQHEKALMKNVARGGNQLDIVDEGIAAQRGQLRNENEGKRTRKKRRADSAASSASNSPRPDPSQAAPADSGNVTPPIDQTNSSLIDRINAAEPGSREYHDLGLELQRRILSEPEVQKPDRRNFAFQSLSSRDLRNVLLEAFRDGDSKVISQASYELWLRDNQAPQIRTSSVEINRASSQEARDKRAETLYDGVSGGLPADTQAFLNSIQSRDPDVQRTARTMTERMLRLLHNSVRQHVAGNVTIMDVNDIYRLAGFRGAPAGVDAAFTDFYRGARRMAIGVKKDGTTAPQSLIHEVAHVVARTLTNDQYGDIINGYRAASRNNERVANYVKANNPGREEEYLAEEWFAEGLSKFLSERVAQGDVFANRGGRELNVTLKSRLRMILDEVIDRLAYVFNGLVGRNTIRQQYRRLFLYGDMLGNGRKATTPSSVERVSLVDAQNIETNMWANTQPEQQLRVNAYASNYPALRHRDGSPKMMFHGSVAGGWMNDPDLTLSSLGDVDRPQMGGNFGKGAIYLTDQKGLADLYANLENFLMRDTGAFFRMAQAAIPDGNEAQWRTIQAGLMNLREDMMFYRDAQRLPDISEPDLAVFKSRVDESLDALRARGVDLMPNVLPTYVDVRNPLDVRNPSSFRRSVARIGRAIGDPDLVEKVEGRIVYNDATSEAGYRRYELLRDWAMEEGLIDEADQFNDFLEQSVDIDGIVGYTESWQRDFGGDLSPEARSVARGEVRAKPLELVVFRSSQVKHAYEATAYDPTSPILRNARTHQAEVPAGNVMVQAAFTDDPFQTNPIAIARAVEDAGGDAKTANFIVRASSNKATPEEYERGAGIWTKTLGRPTDDIRRSGGRWFADRVRPENGPGFYEAFDHRVSMKLMPLLQKMRRLPDYSKGSIPARIRSTFSSSMQRPTSPPERRILRALRTSDFSSLSRDEAVLAGEFRKVFDDIHNEMRALGYPIGYVKNYVPQVWDTIAIRRNRLGFVEGLTEYFVKDDIRNGRVSGRDMEVVRSEANQRAAEIADKLVDEDGVWIPEPAKAKGQRTDYERQRMFQLHDPVNREHLDALQTFLVNDLMGVTTGYVTQLSQRLEMAQRFGVNGHAVDDYLKVAYDGVQGASELLARGRAVERRDGKFVTVGDEGDTKFNIQRRRYQVSPALKPEVANTTAQEAFDILRRGGFSDASASDAVDRILQSYPPAGVTHSTRKRAEAVVNALRDSKGQNRYMTENGARTYDNVMALKGRLMGRPMGSRGARQISQKFRAFNSITLLGFTTLTSMTDVVLPLLRSGSMGSWLRGMKDVAPMLSDPEYRNMFKQMGISGHDLTLERAEMTLTGDNPNARTNKIVSGFFRSIGLSQWTSYMREFSGAVGLSWLEAEQRRLLRSGANTRKGREAMRTLREFGLDDFMQDGSQSLRNAFKDGDPRVAQALIKFANETVFAPRATDIPLWAQTPVGSMLFQLKSFPLMMQRMAGQNIDKVRRWFATGGKEGDLRPFLLSLTMAPAAGSVVLTIKDIVQARGGEGDEPANEARARSASRVLEAFGIDPAALGLDSQEGLDAFLGWWMEGFIYAAGFGLIFETLYSVGEQFENGVYGQNRVASLMFGPSTSLVFDSMAVLQGGVDALQGNDGNAPERAAVRAITQRMPVLGGQRQFREGVVESVAGPARRTGGGQGSYGSYGGSYSGSFGGGYG